MELTGQELGLFEQAALTAFGAKIIAAGRDGCSFKNSAESAWRAAEEFMRARKVQAAPQEPQARPDGALF